MPARLRVLPGRPAPTVTVARHVVVGAAMNAEALAQDIESALRAIEHRLFAGDRAGAINEIGRAHHRVGELRGAFLELAGLGDTTPSDPSGAATAVA